MFVHKTRRDMIHIVADIGARQTMLAATGDDGMRSRRVCRFNSVPATPKSTHVRDTPCDAVALAYNVCRRNNNIMLISRTEVTYGTMCRS